MRKHLAENRITERRYYVKLTGTVRPYLTKVKALQLHKLIFMLQRIEL